MAGVELAALRAAGSGMEEGFVEAVTAGISKTLTSLIGGHEWSDGGMAASKEMRLT
jgi:hypothetical protein